MADAWLPPDGRQMDAAIRRAVFGCRDGYMPWVPAHSTNPAYALDVVKKLAARRWRWTMMAGVEGAPAWLMCIEDEAGRPIASVGWDHFAGAVCRAALMAIEMAANSPVTEDR